MVWPRFPGQESSFLADIVVSDISLRHTSDNPLVRETIGCHPLNQVIQLLIPLSLPTTRGRKDVSVEQVKTRIRELMPTLGIFVKHKMRQNSSVCQKLGYFMVKQVPLHVLMHKVLIEKYVLQGELTAISTSTSTSISGPDSLAILPSGRLVLSLTEKTYHRLGVEGVKCILGRRNYQGKMEVNIDLKSHLVLGFERSKYFTRIFHCFRNSGLKFDVLVKWQPLDKKMFPSSIGKFFKWIRDNPVEGGFMDMNEALDMKITQCLPNLTFHEKSKVHVPQTLINSSTISPNDDLTNIIDDTQFWSGCVLSDISCVRGHNRLDVNSSGKKEEDCQLLSNVLTCQVSGLFTCQDTLELFREIDAKLHMLQPMVPFITMIVSGFESSPVSWDLSHGQHGKKLSGENLFGVLITPGVENYPFGRKSLLWRTSDAFDFSLEKL